MRLISIFLCAVLIPCSIYSQFSYEWAFALGDIYTDRINDMVLDEYGNIYVIGDNSSAFDFDPGEDTIRPYETSHANVFFAKYSKEGELKFVKSIGTNSLGIEYGNEIRLDKHKNIYISGKVNYHADLDPGPGEFLIETVTGSDGFVAKYDSLGNLISYLDFNTDNASAHIELDIDDNILVYGNITYANDFDPGPGEYIIDAGGLQSGFLAKYDSAGTFIYAMKFDTVFSNAVYTNLYISDLKTDHNRNVYMTGLFSGGVDFDTGENLFPLSSFIETLFYAKYDESNHLIFAKKLDLNIGEYFNSPTLVFDSNGNFYIAASFTGTVDFDPDEGEANISSVFNSNIFIVKYDSLGNFKYVKIMEGSGESSAPTNILLGENNNIYLAGIIDGTNDLDPGPGEAIYNVPAYSDMFLAKYDNDGNYITSISMGGAYQEFPWCMALDQEGDVYLAGEFYEEIDPDPYGEDLYLTNGFNDLFVAKYGQNLTPTTDLVPDKSNITVTPNPGTGLFRISFQDSKGINSIRIVDMNGNEVNAKQQFSDTVVVDLEQLPSGVYLGIVSNTSGVQTVKLVKI